MENIGCVCVSLSLSLSLFLSLFWPFLLPENWGYLKNWKGMGVDSFFSKPLRNFCVPWSFWPHVKGMECLGIPKNNGLVHCDWVMVLIRKTKNQSYNRNTLLTLKNNLLSVWMLKLQISTLTSERMYEHSLCLFSFWRCLIFGISGLVRGHGRVQCEQSILMKQRVLIIIFRKKTLNSHPGLLRPCPPLLGSKRPGYLSLGATHLLGVDNRRASSLLRLSILAA